MTDLIEGRSAVREATRRAEEAAGIFRDDNGNETYADTTTPEVPELEGAVPVAASDQPLPEPVADVPGDPAPPEPVVPEPAAEPQSAEELQAEIARLHEQLATKDSFIGRQSTDVGELRAEVDALRAQVTTPVAPTPQPQQHAITQEMINDDPERATHLAFENAKIAAAANGGVGDPAAEIVLKNTFNAWREQDEFTAGAWRYDRLLEQQQKEFDAKLAEVRGEVQTVTAPIAASAAASAEQTNWSNAFLEMQKSYPDFLEVSADGKTNAQRLLEEVAPQFPAIAQLIADGDVAAKVQGLTLLYDKGRLGNPAQMQEELQSAATEAAAEAAATRAAAASVNGQATAGQGSTVALTEEEEEAKRYVTRMTSKPSLASGWTGRGNA